MVERPIKKSERLANEAANGGEELIREAAGDSEQVGSRPSRSPRPVSNPTAIKTTIEILSEVTIEATIEISAEAKGVEKVASLRTLNHPLTWRSCVAQNRRNLNPLW
jgi:hypothetical protein